MAARGMLLAAAVASAAALDANSRGLRLLAKDAPASAANHAGSLVKPMTFDQRLLVCNAYASHTPMEVQKNGQDVLHEAAIPFGTCRDLPIAVLAKDKLDFLDKGAGVQGTFEVGDLPESDAVLLLVLQKRDHRSPLISFQSFAFPMNHDNSEANLAVIDASVELPRAHLEVTDVPGADPKAQTRTEELSFNRIYALESGTYSLAVLEEGEDAPKPAAKNGLSLSVRQATQTEVHLNGEENYVVIRAVNLEGQQSLLAFPRSNIAPRSGAVGRSVALGLLAALARLLL